MSDPLVYTVDELARDVLAIGRRQAYELIRSGQIPGVIRLGRSIRISRFAIDQWLHEAAVGNGSEPVEPQDASWPPM